MYISVLHIVCVFLHAAHIINQSHGWSKESLGDGDWVLPHWFTNVYCKGSRISGDNLRVQCLFERSFFIFFQSALQGYTLYPCCSRCPMLKALGISWERVNSRKNSRAIRCHRFQRSFPLHCHCRTLNEKKKRPSNLHPLQNDDWCNWLLRYKQWTGNMIPSGKLT